MAAEVTAAAAVVTAVLKLGTVLKQQLVSLDVKKDVEWLIEELKWMESFLKDAENKLDGSHLSQLWMSDVRNLASDCEDVIEIFEFELGEPKTPARCLAVMPSCCISYATSPNITRKLKSDIEGLKTRLNDISSRQARYEPKNNNIGSTSGSKNEVQKLMDLRRSTPYANNERMVGQEDTVSLLMNELRNGRSSRFVVFIVGMGGLGKTTIAKKLYQKLHINFFTCYSWICVSQVYDLRAILLQLIKSMTNPSKNDLDRLTDTESMELYLCDFLRTRRFLIVLDDLWEREAWEMLQRALPDNNNGSRVVITSRNVNVAKGSEAYVHELRRLQGDEGWELFCKKAFPNDMKISPRIENLGKEMVAKCSGLPLAIVTLGGLLSTKSNSVSEWKLIRDHLWKELKKEDSLHINALLSLSYRDLPAYLKPCFLYVGMFPEDFDIPISKLILLWVAEGFIVGSERRTPESVAKSYFNELVGRSLFQKKGEDWIHSTFRVHDLLRDLAIEKAKDEGFSVYCDENRLHSLTGRSLHRRLVACQPEDLLSRYKNPSLRTLFTSSTVSREEVCMNDTYIDIHSELLRSVHLHYSLLRVIDIRAGGYICVPSEIGRLIRLRYLGIDMFGENGHVKKQWEIPDTIGNLKDLQTLSIRTLNKINLPPTMEKLQALRHLIGNFVLGDWIEKLIGLETLQGIKYDQWLRIDTTNLVNLRHLSLIYYDMSLEVNLMRFYDNFQTVTKLQTFGLLNVGTLGSPDVLRIFQCCPEITHFNSWGIYLKLENLYEFATNLEVLDVTFPENKEDPMPVFERLPALRALRLQYVQYNNKKGEKMVCSGEGFPQLQTLVIELWRHMRLVVEEGGMPMLTCLKTNNSQNVEAPKRLMDLIVETTDRELV